MVCLKDCVTDIEKAVEFLRAMQETVFTFLLERTRGLKSQEVDFKRRNASSLTMSHLKLQPCLKTKTMTAQQPLIHCFKFPVSSHFVQLILQNWLA